MSSYIRLYLYIPFYFSLFKTPYKGFNIGDSHHVHYSCWKSLMDNLTQKQQVALAMHCERPSFRIIVIRVDSILKEVDVEVTVREDGDKTSFNTYHIWFTSKRNIIKAEPLGSLVLTMEDVCDGVVSFSLTAGLYGWEGEEYYETYDFQLKERCAWCLFDSMAGDYDYGPVKTNRYKHDVLKSN